MESLLFFLAQAFCLWVGAQYVLGPFALWLLLTVPERYAYPRLDPATLLAGDRRAQPLHDDVLRLGFAPAGATTVGKVSGLYYAHPQDGAAACVLITPKYVALVFSQHYLQARLYLSNSSTLSPWPRWNRKITHRLPACRDAAKLFDHFRAIRAKLALPDPVKASVDSELAMSEDFENEQLARLIHIGYFAKTLRKDKRRARFKGALRMAWKLAWPSRPILVLIETRRTKAAAGIA